MGRVRAKGKKLSATSLDDHGSGEEEKIPAQKRRGRPQKQLKDEFEEEEESQKLEDEDSEDTSGITNKDLKDKTVSQNGKKRKTSAQVKEKIEENGIETTKSTELESKESNGFRHSRSRRKNKPHRAAEAVLECN